ncbi:LPS export ABC transporter periplasmic protein LptC [Winogradskyella sp. A3E31]|uniref:LPS export ABC transporter periplasmic protein LptC n=1 Tax=Winogradskyella sp. A3E31 TaxID=3349637 RepID=UPI00398B498B
MTALVVIVLFSCKDNFSEVQQIGVLQNAPIGEADTINLKYTDSAKLTANLLSPKMMDYSNRPFSFSEFPEGIELIIYDKNNNKSTIFADYAIAYNETDLIDLQGNVLLATHKGDSLFAPQMYYDQKNEWVFTNQEVKLRSTANNIDGRGFDSDRDFKGFEILEMAGDIQIDN